MCSPARWYYDPVNGAVKWKGDWNDGHYTGKWKLSLQPSADYLMINVFSMQWGTVSPDVDEISFSSDPTVNMNVFSHAAPMGLYNTTNISHHYPWVFCNTVTVQWLTYAEIRAIGEDRDDTSPLSWDDMP